MLLMLDAIAYIGAQQCKFEKHHALFVRVFGTGYCEIFHKLFPDATKKHFITELTQMWDKVSSFSSQVEGYDL